MIKVEGCQAIPGTGQPPATACAVAPARSFNLGKPAYQHNTVIFSKLSTICKWKSLYNN